MKSLPNKEPVERWKEEYYKEFNGGTNCPCCDAQNFTEDETEHRNDCLLVKMESFISHQKAISRAEGAKEERAKRHNWVINKGLTKYAYCEKCAHMMKYGDNDWDCPGMAEITFRDKSLSDALAVVDELEGKK